MLTYEQRQELENLTPEEIKDRLYIALPNDLIYNLESVTNKHTAIKGICPRGHEYTRNVLDLIKNPACLGCISEEKRRKESAILEKSWTDTLAPFYFKPNSFNRRKPKRPLLLTCQNNHGHLTTILDIVEETENLTKPYLCPVCVEQETTLLLMRDFDNWMNDVNNQWFGCKVECDVTAPPTTEEHEVTVTCSSGHKSVDTIYNFKRSNGCSICKEIERIENLPKPLPYDSIRQETRQTELYLAGQFEARHPCPNGHNRVGGKCGICDGDEQIHVETLVPYLSTLSQDKYLFETGGDIININDEMNVFCKDHGVFQRTAKEISQGLGCQYCTEESEVKNSLYVYTDGRGSYFFGVTSLMDNHKSNIESTHDYPVTLMTIVSGLNVGALYFILEMLKRATEHLSFEEPSNRFLVTKSFSLHGVENGHLTTTIDPLIKAVKQALNGLHVCMDHRYSDGVRLTFPQILTIPCL